MPHRRDRKQTRVELERGRVRAVIEEIHKVREDEGVLPDTAERVPDQKHVSAEFQRVTAAGPSENILEFIDLIRTEKRTRACGTESEKPGYLRTNGIGIRHHGDIRAREGGACLVDQRGSQYARIAERMVLRSVRFRRGKSLSKLVIRKRPVPGD